MRKSLTSLKDIAFGNPVLLEELRCRMISVIGGVLGGKIGKG
jgi:hypothetical protein